MEGDATSLFVKRAYLHLITKTKHTNHTTIHTTQATSVSDQQCLGFQDLNSSPPTS